MPTYFVTRFLGEKNWNYFLDFLLYQNKFYLGWNAQFCAHIAEIQESLVSLSENT